MARNEEKQLARLNRLYLEKQKQEELKKRPPRPRLDTLTTSREIRKWLPTINRDIEFYVKQMEVPCYTESKIKEFSDRIQQLKQEYRAYLHKLRALEPDVNPSLWTRRPYTNRKRAANSSNAEGKEEAERSDSSQEDILPGAKTTHNFEPLSTPVLQTMSSFNSCCPSQKPVSIVWNVNPETEDLPLQFCPPKALAICDNDDSSNRNDKKHILGAGSAETVMLDSRPDQADESENQSNKNSWMSGTASVTKANCELYSSCNSRTGVIASKTRNEKASFTNLLNLEYSDSSDDTS